MPDTPFTPLDILVLRKSLGLTQVELERLVGLSPKTVVRWEGGSVHPTRGTDTLLRVLRDVPGAVEYLARLRGVTLSPPGYTPVPASKRFL